MKECVTTCLRHFFWEGNNHAVTLDGGGQRQTDARVTRRRLDQRVALLDAARLFGILDHATTDAVLDLK